jgi:hypothetical protein
MSTLLTITVNIEAYNRIRGPMPVVLEILAMLGAGVVVGAFLGLMGGLLPLKRGRRSDRRDVVRFQREMSFINRDRDVRLEHQSL